ncbi:uncharacterized protein [Leptinotarsa decemlineata]|uniref:uncharacterized protein n=1 Tax=Leptinotarsa decemlineata TaxID=7539 RepID=UPI003D30491B
MVSRSVKIALPVTKFFEFNPENDEWEIYVERLGQHYVANQVTEEKVKVAILLSSVSQTTFKLLKDLSFPDTPQSKSFERLNTLLKKQFSSSRGIWRERRKFYEMTQGVLSVAEWYAKIRSAATLCGCQDDLTRALKDKFVTGLAPGKILEDN